MTRRTTRIKFTDEMTPQQQESYLNTLQEMRGKLIQYGRPLFHGTPHQKAVKVVIRAIDESAEQLTGDPEYFWAKGGQVPDHPKNDPRFKKS